MRRSQLIEDIATAVQEAGSGTVDRATRVNAVAGKPTGKPPETTATRTVTLTTKPVATAAAVPMAGTSTARRETAYKRLTEEEYRKRKEEVDECMEEKGKAVMCRLNTIVGLTTPGMIKVRGTVQGREVVVLLDWGATNNFMSQKLVSELKIPQSETFNYGIIVGTRTTLKGQGICCRVILELPEVTVVEDFLPIELNDLDVILGMKWLQSMGKMKTDWPALTMSFIRGDKWIMLRGDPTLARLEVSLKRLTRAWQETDQGSLWNCGP